MVNYQGPHPAGEFCSFELEAYKHALWKRENAKKKYVEASTQTDPVQFVESLSIDKVE